MIDTELFKYRLAVAGLTITDIASLLGISKQAVYKKVSGQTDWSTPEMYAVSDAMKLTPEESKAIFYANKCDKKSQ